MNTKDMKGRNPHTTENIIWSILLALLIFCIIGISMCRLLSKSDTDDKQIAEMEYYHGGEYNDCLDILIIHE